MFGYVRIFKPEMKMGEFDQYQGVYCSVCKQLGKRYGFFARMTLSYDFTFLAIFRMAMDTSCAGFQKGRCPFNPLKKRLCCGDNPHVQFAADAATLLTYYKVRDNIADSGFFHSIPARLLLPFAFFAKRKAAKLHPALNEKIAACMQAQTALEAAKTTSLDAAADPTAQILAMLSSMTAKEEDERNTLEWFGYCLGRWIYLMDAVDDLQEDIQKGQYNPYAFRTQEPAYMRQTLNACAAECTAAYDKLKLYRFDGILRNVLELGMPAAQEEVLTSEGKRKNV